MSRRCSFPYCFYRIHLLKSTYVQQFRMYLRWEIFRSWIQCPQRKMKCCWNEAKKLCARCTCPKEFDIDENSVLKLTLNLIELQIKCTLQHSAGPQQIEIDMISAMLWILLWTFFHFFHVYSPWILQFLSFFHCLDCWTIHFSITSLIRSTYIRFAIPTNTFVNYSNWTKI